MISIVGEKKTVSHWAGGSLKMFGTNPWGESLWRVVWSDSREYMVGGMWVDRSSEMPNDAQLAAQGGKDYSISGRVAEYRHVPLYPGIHAWVLEKWLPAVEFAGTPADYERTQKDSESGLLTLGPYPSRGEFQHVFSFPAGDPPRSKVIEFIQAIERGRHFTPAQRKQAYLDDIEAKRVARENRAVDIYKDAIGPFDGNPVSGIPGKKTADKVRFKYAAEDLGMPVGDGKFFQN